MTRLFRVQPVFGLWRRLGSLILGSRLGPPFANMCDDGSDDDAVHGLKVKPLATIQ